MAAVFGENEIMNTRLFGFPREAVFKAWTTPEQLARWWGPKGFTNTFEEFDLRPGGAWRFVMHGPNGVDYPNESAFEEIVPLERIVIHHLNGPEFMLTATFEESEGGTKVIFCQRFITPGVLEGKGMKEFLAEANEQNFDRLNQLLMELKE